MRYDIVGCGAVVRLYHVPILKLLRDRGEVTIVGCYDPSSSQARHIAAELGAERYGDSAEPHEGDGVDGALIATPPELHARIASEYIDAGKGVFVEKPLTVTSDEVRGLIQRSEKNGVRVVVNQFWRFYPSVNIARRWLRNHLDEVISIEATEGFRWDWAPASNYVTENAYGGVIHDTGAHLIDMVIYLLGLDEDQGALSVDVTELAKTPQREPSHECRARLVLGASEDHRTEVELVITRLRPLGRGVKVRGTFGTLFVPTSFARAPILFQGADALRLRGAEPTVEARDPDGCFLLTHLDFLSALRNADRPLRLDAQRFVLQLEILERLHGGAGK
jgi:Predicted dehydrogenases and related proteins